MNQHSAARKSCPACSSAQVVWFATSRDVEYQTTDESFDYWQCLGCETVFLPNAPVDRLREIYPPHYYAYNAASQCGPLEWIKRQLDQRMLSGLLRQLPGERLNVLDAGGGWGWLLSAARHACPRVSETHVVDIDPAAKPRAEAAGHVYHTCRVEDFRSERRFDLILLLNLLEHVADPAAVLKAMRQLLTPSGRLVIKTPNVATWDQRLFRHRDWGGFHCPRHFVLFTADSLRGLVQRCGLEQRTLKYTQGAPQWTASILANLARRGWIRPKPMMPLLKHPLAGPLLAATAAFDFVRSPFAKTAQMIMTCQAAAAVRQNVDNEHSLATSFDHQLQLRNNRVASPSLPAA